MFRLFLVLPVFLFNFYFCLAQSVHPDILYLEQLQKNDLNTAKIYADSILSSSIKKTGIHYNEVRINLANTLRMLGDLDSAILIIDQIALSQLKSVKIKVKQLLSKADILEDQGESDRAMTHYLKAIDLAKENSLKHELSMVYNNLGANYLYKGNYAEANSYLLMALNIRKELGDSLRISKTLNNLGAVHRRLSQLDSARFYYNQSIAIKEQLNDVIDLNAVFLNIAILDQIEGKRLEAIKVYEKVIQSSLEVKDYETVVLGQVNMANAYLALKDFKNSESSYLKGLEYSELYKDNATLSVMYRGLAIISEKNGDATKVHQYRKLYHSVYVEMFNLEMEKEVSRLETKFNLSEKDREIEVLNRQQITSELKLKQDELIASDKLFWIYLSITVLILSLIFVFVIYWRKRIFAQKQDALLKEREILLKEVHHRVKNNLQIVSSLLSIQSKIGTGINPQEILQHAQNRIQSIAIIHEKLYQSVSLADVKLDAYFTELIDHLSASYDLNENGVKIQHKMDPISMDIDRIVPCGLILNELITNSIKHAFNKGGIIYVRCFLKNGEIIIDIEDNGIGLDENFDLSKSQTLGLKLSIGLAKQLKGTLNLIEASKAHFQLKINQIG